MINPRLLLLLITVLSFTNCSKESDQSVPEDEIQLTDRERVIVEYNEKYLGSQIIDPEWTGNAATCDAGTVPNATHEMVAQRLNYFRRLVGLNSITLDESLFAKCQQTALLMKANNKLSHDPPETWACWSQEAAEGASDSNLSASHSTEAITRLIEDTGQNNKGVPHRRWIFHSTKTQFSYGTTNSTMALAVKGVANGNSQVPSYIAYPPNGFMPAPLVFPRWSFSIPNADFSSASIVMNGPDGPVALNIISNSYNQFSFIGDNSIVWEPQGVNTNSAVDQSYTVTISNIDKAPQTSYSYDIIIIEP